MQPKREQKPKLFNDFTEEADNKLSTLVKDFAEEAKKVAVLWENHSNIDLNFVLIEKKLQELQKIFYAEKEAIQADWRADSFRDRDRENGQKMANLVKGITATAEFVSKSLNIFKQLSEHAEESKEIKDFVEAKKTYYQTVKPLSLSEKIIIAIEEFIYDVMDALNKNVKDITENNTAERFFRGYPVMEREKAKSLVEAVKETHKIAAKTSQEDQYVGGGAGIDSGKEEKYKGNGNNTSPSPRV